MPCWIKMASVGIFILFLIIEEKLSAFYQWVWCWTEKAMAPHSSTLAWKIPWMEDPGRLQSMGSLRVGHEWATSLSLSTFIHWRRKWQTTSVFLPGESQGQGSLVGCRLWGRTESDTTEATYHQQQHDVQYGLIIYSLYYTVVHSLNKRHFNRNYCSSFI